MDFNIFDDEALYFLSKIGNESVDCIITDPPYESLEKHRKIGTTTRLKNSKGSSNNWFETFPNSLFDELCSELYRVLRPNRHCYIFCDQETMFHLKPAGEKAGFKFWKPLVWDKMAIGMGYHYRARYELILFFEKGKRKLSNLGIPDVLQFKRIHNKYPAQKPVDLIEVLVNQSTDEGEVIIDPFMGSGSTGVAAVKNKRIFVGTDLSAEAFDLSKRRIGDVQNRNSNENYEDDE